MHTKANVTAMTVELTCSKLTDTLEPLDAASLVPSLLTVFIQLRLCVCEETLFINEPEHNN